MRFQYEIKCSFPPERVKKSNAFNLSRANILLEFSNFYHADVPIRQEVAEVIRSLRTGNRAARFASCIMKRWGDKRRFGQIIAATKVTRCVEGLRFFTMNVLIF